jgi:hypothetical protein
MVVWPIVTVNSLQDDYIGEIDNFGALKKFLMYFVSGINFNEFIQYAQMSTAGKFISKST